MNWVDSPIRTGSTDLLHQVRWTLRQEDHTNEQEDRRYSAETAEHAPVDVGTNKVYQENSNREEELKEGAECATDRGLSDLGYEHGGDDARASRGNTGKDSGCVQHRNTGRGYGEYPCDEEGQT